MGVIFAEKELEQNSVSEEISATAADGKKYNTRFYNLEVIIAVGYRISSYKATKFRQWATRVLKEYLVNILLFTIPNYQAGRLPVLIVIRGDSSSGRHSTGA